MGSLGEWVKPELIWFLVGLAMLLWEFAAPGFIIFFFGIGAWIVAVICLIADVSLNLQLGLFIVISVLLLVSLRKWVKKIFMGRITSKESADESAAEFIGRKAVVTKEITPIVNGKVEFRGSTWNAEAEEIIPQGTTVEIIGIDSITLKVKSIKKE